MPREKFTQIYAALKSRIESGVYPVGQLLPSENTLIGEFSCSRNTVRRAISELVRDGYVQTSQGKGVCNIFQPIERSSYTMGTIESFRETAQRTGQHTATRVVELERCVAGVNISLQTGFPVGTELFSLSRVHEMDGKPIILNHSYLRVDCMPDLTEKIAQGSLYRYLEEELGMVIVTSKRTITVEPVTGADKKWLDLGEYNCVAVVSNQVYNSQGVMFEYTQSRHVPSIFRFQDNAVRRSGARNSLV